MLACLIEQAEETVAQASESVAESSGAPSEVPDCLICLTSLEDEDGEGEDDDEPVHTTSCGHLFHLECFEMWTGTCASKGLKITCPSCRADVTG
jgi:hypothetical protein